MRKKQRRNSPPWGITMRNYNTDPLRIEECPARTDQPRYRRHHKWQKVKGSDRPHPSKRGFRVNQEKCRFCGEVVHGEYTLL